MKHRGQIELAIIKGLILAIAVVGSFLIYETIQAKTSSGQQIQCKWDCSNAKWSSCVDGFIYRDISQCKVDNTECWSSEPKPDCKAQCSN